MKKGLAKSRSGIVAALDIGSTKICCLIARTHDGGPAPLIGINHATAARPRVIGVGHQVSKGVKSGVIVDMEAADAAGPGRPAGRRWARRVEDTSLTFFVDTGKRT